MNLGGLPNPRDSRDRLLGSYAPATGKGAVPDTYDTDISGVLHLYQAYTSSCGAHAGAGMEEILGIVKKLSPRFLWKIIKGIDKLPPQSGTYLRAIMQALNTVGICGYDLLPNKWPMGENPYANPTITDEMIADAKNNRIKDNYAFDYAPTKEGLKYYIFQYKAVILLIHCDDGFFGTTRPTFTQKKYGHFVVAYGYNDEGIMILDSTEDNLDLSLKLIPWYALINGFIYELGTAVNLEDHKFTFQTDLHYGNSNNDVRELQMKLLSLGYSIPDGPTYYYGSETRSAVIKFQDDHNIALTWAQRNLPRSSVVGPKTRATLNSL